MSQLRLQVEGPDLGQLPGAVEVEEIDLNLAEATFKGAVGLPAHQWYKLRPSFSPFLVELLLDRLWEPGMHAFDPFSGAGTTVLECKTLGIDAHGVELNPFLARFTDLALDWSTSPEELSNVRATLRNDLHDWLEKVGDMDLEEAVEALGVPIPPIHNALRWWRPDVLRDLLAVKRLLWEQESGTPAYRVMWLTLSTVCIEVANIKRLHPTLTFFDRSGEPISVLHEVESRIDMITHDLGELHELDAGASGRVLEGDALRATELLTFDEPVTLITSPPYVNRYSYVWETRPHLYMMDLISTGKEAAALDLAAPGGTWGSATSVLMKGELEPRTDVLAEQLSEPVRALRENEDFLMANYVVKYFNMMDEHFDEMGRLLPPGSRFAYVVGNSRIKGIDVHTQAIMAHQFESKRWATAERIVSFRKRIGRRALYELAIVGRVT